jgi:hypothetical protein
MRIINNARTGIKITFYENRLREPFGIPLGDTAVILKDGESWQWDRMKDAVEMRIRVWRTGAPARVLWDSSEEGARTFRNACTYVICASNRQRVVDWSACKARWTGLATDVTQAQDGPNADIDKGLEVAAALLAGITTAVRGIGPQAALGAGLTAGLGSILLLAFKTDAGAPQPPDLTAIEAAVEKVVARELDKQDAEAIASNFYGASDRFLRIAGDVYDDWLANKEAGVTKDLHPHIEADLEQFVDGIENSTARGSLLSDIDLLCRAPQIAQYVLPAFVTGIATTLHVKRLHELMKAAVTDPATGALQMEVRLAAVRNMRDHVAKCSDGLEQAIAAYEAHRTELAKDEGLFETSLQSELEIYVNRSIVGVDDLRTLRTAVDDLKEIQALLDDDLRSQKVQHFWRGFEVAQ